MKRILFNAQCLLAVFFLLANFSFATAQVTKTPEPYIKPNRVSFETTHGNITITLPSHLYRGEIVSGSLAIEPKGANEKKQLKNTDILNNYTVSLPEKDFLIGQSKVNCELPATEKMNILLYDKKGTLSASKIIDTDEPSVEEKNADYYFPPYVIAGLPARITGNFDGYFFNSYIYVNGEEAKLLAESGNELIFEVPAGISGTQILDFSESDVTKEIKINVLELTLDPDQLELAKGETAEVTMLLAGFQDIKTPIRVYIKNDNPTGILFEGGNERTIVVEPGTADESGIFSTSFQAKATKNAKLSVSVSFGPPLGSENQ